jgi:hypothetical protein
MRSAGCLHRSQAAELLEKRGVIEIWPETNLYRLKPAQNGQ